MVLQNVLCGEGEMYLRSSGTVFFPGRAHRQRNLLQVLSGGSVSTDTYMNAFDMGAWKRYTDVSGIVLKVSLRGSGKIRLFHECFGSPAVCLETCRIGPCGQGQEREYCFRISDDCSQGILYFEFAAEEDSILEARFETVHPPLREIRISLIICTYRRKRQLEELTATLRRGNVDSPGWLMVRIVDNASQTAECRSETMQVCHNPNTGGSGGFSRGMDETVKDLQRFPATHVVLMDDDAVIQMESLYRLRAVLALIKSGFEDEVIAGRMFRMDKPQVQYTAAEAWNGGDIRHIGWNQAMSDRDCIWTMNDNSGAEYSGWWFACFSINFVKGNRPFPFFLHCDDVEYGLRHGGTPVILNGIQVWHETHEHRQHPVTAYYDTRNPMIVNAVCHIETDLRILMNLWKDKITAYHIKGDYLSEYMAIRAVKDFLKGPAWFLRTDTEALHCRLQKKKKTCLLRLENAFLWRLVEKRTQRRLSRVMSGYEKLRMEKDG